MRACLFMCVQIIDQFDSDDSLPFVPALPVADYRHSMVDVFQVRVEYQGARLQ
jgi:hypothetical protein